MIKKMIMMITKRLIFRKSVKTVGMIQYNSLASDRPLHCVLNLFCTCPLIPSKKLFHARKLPAMGQVQVWAAFHMWKAVDAAFQTFTWCIVPKKADDIGGESSSAR